MPKAQKWEFPASMLERMESIARESARMSYPSSMSRGTGQVVSGGTKKITEQFFCDARDIQDVIAGRILTNQFDQWHEKVCKKLAAQIRNNVCGDRKPIAVAAKFVDTFMHQLMKYEECRALWPALHLPLDQLIFKRLRRVRSSALEPLAAILSRSPYTLGYLEHMRVQNALNAWIKELNARAGMEYTLGSRVELNWVWALAKR